MINNFVDMPSAISKILSANDTGETGGHQAGMLIPKVGDVLGFFPNLDSKTKNPRAKLKFRESSGEEWNFTFIYYNNKYFNGTRNEFRLTGMTAFIRKNNLKADDIIVLSSDELGRNFINYERVKIVDSSKSILKLGSSWKVVAL
jgi:hypothetical protein